MNLLILGGNSDVAHAVALKFAGDANAGITLASRDMELLEKKAKDIEIRCNTCVLAVAFDAADPKSHASFYHRLDPKPDVVVAAFGYPGDQNRAQSDGVEARRIIETNFTGAVSILEIAAADLETKRKGTIIGIGSVAGLRGRQSNYIYGAAKGALGVYLSGLRNRLSRSGVHVITVLPGFIDTKMTAGMELPVLLTATPKQVADDIYHAYQRSKNTIYTRWFWRWIMAIIRSIPEPLFKRLSL